MKRWSTAPTKSYWSASAFSVDSRAMRQTDKQIRLAISRKIRDARVSRGWTKERLAEALDVSPEMVWKYETGRSAVGVALLHRLARLLRCDLAWLVGVEVPGLDGEQRRLLEAFGRLNAERRALLLAVALAMAERG